MEPGLPSPSVAVTRSSTTTWSSPKRIPNGVVIDVVERLKHRHDRGADGRLPGVEGAMRLSASRNLPDAIVVHQRQRAVDIVSVPRLQKATHDCVVVARHFGCFRSPASRQ